MAELVYLSLGTNVGDRSTNLKTAIKRLQEAGTVIAVSGIYETEPVELCDQPWFLNCVVALETGQSPLALLKTLLAIEQEMGRLRMKDKGPRLIDIDILLFGERVVEERGLKIPHPAMHQRRFVLEPLVGIGPEAWHPKFRKTARELLAILPAGQAVRLLKPKSV
ncbi:MAG: 2-amino-4-hydroxy-6-hydroxymethyldihydropteridine diphosphokinase [Terriglobales bacterium]